MNKSKSQSYLIIEKSIYGVNDDDSLSFCTAIDLEDMDLDAESEEECILRMRDRQ